MGLRASFFPRLPLLCGTVALAGCAGQSPALPLGGGTASGSFLPGSPAGGPSSAGMTGTSGNAAANGPVALLLPLSGTLQPIGQILENAAKLAMGPGAPALDIRDTGGTPQGAAAAARAALAAGDGLILGPLTSGEAHAVAPLAQAAHVDMLAFTNDGSIAAAGIWPLGITPDQQVRRVLQAANAAGRGQVAALLPDTDFGHSLATAIQAAGSPGSPPAGSLPTDNPPTGSLPADNPPTGSPPAGSPDIVFYEPGFSGLNQAVERVSDFADRGASLMAQIKTAQDLNTAAGAAQARQLQHQPIPPPGFDLLFIGATAPEELAEIATLLPYYSVDAPQVQLLGPARWADVATAMATRSVYQGALFAGPDPAAAAGFDAKYQAAYGSPPPAIADVAYDAAAIAAAAAAAGGDGAALTSPAGFAGTDGVLQLAPDGQVQRGLAVFQLAPGGAVISRPAATSLPEPSS